MELPRSCYRCGSRYGRRRVRCDCGEPLWSVERATGDRLETGTSKGMWRYEQDLPVSPPAGLARAVGDTPLVRVEGLDPVAGCRVSVKVEGQNPTGSYKDRGSAVAVALACCGDDAVGTVSYGNMAMSTAAHAASLGRECVVLVPADIPPGRLSLIAQYDPTILRVEGDYGALYHEALALERELPVSFLLSDHPTRVSGYRTALFELYDARPGLPDALVVPTSSGGFASGLWKGLLDLREAGLLDGRGPRLYLVQPAAADPITRAFTDDRDAVEALPPEAAGETVATSLGNPDPPSGTRALTAARETDGGVVSVTDDEIRTAQRRFARRGGLCVEAASAVTLAGAARLRDDGELDSDDRVVLIPTGSGFKELGSGEPTVDPETVTRERLPERLETVLTG